MNRHLQSAIATGAIRTMAMLSAAVIISPSVHADDITVEQASFVSSRTREEVNAELKEPWPGGNPWAGSYNMFQSRNTATSEQVQAEYMTDRDKMNALHAEDSGSAYIMKAQGIHAPRPGVVTGAPKR